MFGDYLTIGTIYISPDRINKNTATTLQLFHNFNIYRYLAQQRYYQLSVNEKLAVYTWVTDRPGKTKTVKLDLQMQSQHFQAEGK